MEHTAEREIPDRTNARFVEEILDLSAPGAPPPSESETMTQHPLPIVIAEDQDDARDVLVTALQLAGHHASPARNGDEAVDLISNVRPRVALIDIGMPGRDGYAVAREVRRRLGASVGLIALSGYGRPDDVRRARDAGFDTHITKPVELEQLLAAIADLTREG